MWITLLHLFTITRLGPYGDDIRNAKATNWQYFEYVTDLLYGSFTTKYLREPNDEVTHVEHTAFLLYVLALSIYFLPPKTQNF